MLPIRKFTLGRFTLYSHASDGLSCPDLIDDSVRQVDLEPMPYTLAWYRLLDGCESAVLAVP